MVKITNGTVTTEVTQGAYDIIVVVFDLQVSRYHSSIPPFADSV